MSLFVVKGSCPGPSAIKWLMSCSLRCVHIALLRPLMISLGLSTVEVLISCSSGCACSHGTAVIIVCCQGQMPAPCSSEVVNFLLLKVRSHWMVFTLHSYVIVCCQGQMPAPFSSEVVNFLLLKVRSHWMVFTLHSYVIVCCHGQMPGAFSSQVVNLLPLKARSHSFLRRVHTAQGHCLKWPHGHCLKMLGAFCSQVVGLQHSVVDLAGSTA